MTLLPRVTTKRFPRGAARQTPHLHCRPVSDQLDAASLGPLLSRRRGFRLVRALFRAVQRVTVPVRRRYYLHGEHRRLVGLLPPAARRAVGLDDVSAIGSNRLEIGGGPHAQTGFLHVDIDPGAHHLEWVAPAWDLPLPDGWASEIVAVHALEHVEPARLVETLAEWRRVLAPSARVQVHVPNGPALMRAFTERPVPEKWPIIGSILGMYCSPDVRDPSGLHHRSDHQLIFDLDLLRWALETAGFRDVRDLTGAVEDRHTAPWRELVPHYSLIVEARKPGP
jgi:predicted SAM-dependent methyltransferase